MDTTYKKSTMTFLQEEMALAYYEKNIRGKVGQYVKGKGIWYECHIDWIEWGLFKEYETIRKMDFDEAAKYVAEWLETRDKTYYSTPLYIQMLDNLAKSIEENQ